MTGVCLHPAIMSVLTPHVHIFGGMLVRVISMHPTTRGLILLLLLLIYQHHLIVAVIAGEAGREGMTSELMLNKMLTSIG